LVLKKVAWSLGGIFIWKFLPVNFSKLILGFYGALFVAVVVWSGAFFVQMHRDYTALKAQETANQRRLAEAEARLQTQEKYLDQLRHDPALIEHIIRQKLGYAREQEFVFRFEDQK
jgi:cell division protein DivIC